MVIRPIRAAARWRERSAAICTGRSAPHAAHGAGREAFCLAIGGRAAENAAIWARSLRAWTGQINSRELAPGAVVLALRPADSALAAQQYGDGRVMAFAGDSTWRWQLHGFEAAYKRFWRQIVLWLAKKDQAGEGSVWIRLDERRLQPVAAREFTAAPQNPSGEPVKDAEFKAEIVLPDGRAAPSISLRQDDRESGSFRDTMTAGDYAIEVKATQKGQELGSSRARFLVSPQDSELDNAAADGDAMNTLAELSGGESVAPEDLGKPWSNASAVKPPHSKLNRKSKRPSGTPGRSSLRWWRFLSLEWYLRKRWGLV